MLKETCEREVLTLTRRIMGKRDESREACIAECEQVIDQIIASQWVRVRFPLTDRPKGRRLGDHLKSGSDATAAYAMSVAVGVFAGLRAYDEGMASPAYDFSGALSRRAEIAR